MPAQKNIDFWVWLLLFCFIERLFVLEFFDNTDKKEGSEKTIARSDCLKKL